MIPDPRGAKRVVSPNMKMTEPEDKIVAEATAGLPNGMTQEEADRLVLEADRKQKENT